MSDPDERFTSRQIPVERVSVEECVAIFAHMASQPDIYYEAYFAKMVWVYLSPFTREERKQVYTQLDSAQRSLLKSQIASYLSKFGAEDTHAGLMYINPHVPAHLTEECFPLAPVREILSEL